MKAQKDIFYRDDCALDVYLPDSADYETIVYFHGGGMEHGDKGGKCEQVGADFVNAGYAFVSVNYRLYPNAKFPDYLYDVAQAVAYVKKNVGGKKLYVSGSSAGGWLATMLCMNSEYLQSVGVQNADIDGWIIDSSQMTSHFNVQRFETGKDARLQRIDEYAPLYFVNENTAFSKMLLIFYENDMPCRYEQNMLFYKAVLYFNKDVDICYCVLKGGHCAGVSKRGDDGEFSFVQTVLTWLKGERKWML
ncbi:MAG: alpha/beta hydrolase [Clostridia bacterium]|nr:alpha/beta hydrolase [Clostridia bacterium]